MSKTRKSTIEVLKIWKSVHYPAFNYGEFAIIKSDAGLNSFILTAKQWMEKTEAIGLVSKSGYYV
jgi:hypothetical protein